MPLQDPAQTPSTDRTHSIGGSILPSSDPSILKPLKGRHGTFCVRPLPEIDSYGLFLNETNMLVMHANGYSCHTLATRIIDAWEGKEETSFAMSQFDYIMQCGGLGRERSAIEYYASGLQHNQGADVTPS